MELKFNFGSKIKLTIIRKINYKSVVNAAILYSMDDLNGDAQSLFNNSNVIESDKLSKKSTLDYEITKAIQKEVKETMDGIGSRLD